jgi:hypothetical protein
MANSSAVTAYTPPGTPDTVELAVTPSGNYAAGGDTINLNPSAFRDPNGVGVLGQPLSVPTRRVRVVANNAGGYYPQFVPGATLATSKLQWFAPGGAEVAAGAYPAAITGAQVTVYLPLY